MLARERGSFLITMKPGGSWAARLMELYLQAIEFIITPQHYSTLPQLAWATTAALFT